MTIPDIPYIGPYPLVQAKKGDAGYDITANESKRIHASSSESISTGLYMAIPEGWHGKLCSRSGLSFNHDLEVGAGVIDTGFRGEIKVKLYNHGPNAVLIKKGDRIAQIIMQEHKSPTFVLVKSLDENTERGTNGFGHTGVGTQKSYTFDVRS